jgi:hypothetical protein
LLDLVEKRGAPFELLAQKSNCWQKDTDIMKLKTGKTLKFVVLFM